MTSLNFIEFKYPNYKQLYSPFTENLSIVDMLFNIGIEESKKLILI